MKKTIQLFVLAIFLMPAFSQGQQIKNVILMIGDGMGLSQVTTAFYYGKGDPNFSRFTTIGLINTSSASDTCTDSAAGATAFACGIKSYNGSIGVNTDTAAVESIVERISKNGIHTGVIATSGITHATPASFYAHVKSRSLKEPIADALTKSEVDFFAGGGLQYFINREDGRNLLSEMKKRGISVDTTSLNKELLAKNDRVGFLLSRYGMPSMREGRGNFLAQATTMCANYLNDKQGKGFFMMVEGSQIDWAGHSADAKGIIEETLDFDEAIGAALDFAAKDGHTLVIVTADHETGGFALCPKNDGIESDYNSIEPQFYQGAKDLSNAAHTTTLIPVFAWGPGSELFGGIYQNNEIFHKILKVANW